MAKNGTSQAERSQLPMTLDTVYKKSYAKTILYNLLSGSTFRLVQLGPSKYHQENKKNAGKNCKNPVYHNSQN